MGFDKILEDFCREHDYIGRISYQEPYEIILFKGTDGIGAFPSKEEFEEFDDYMFKEILIFLDRYFKEKFNK